MASQILTERKVDQKIARIALEIIERNSGDEKLILVGIEATGYQLAQRISTELIRFGSVERACVPLKIHKPNPLLHPISAGDSGTDQFDNAVVILIDDVQNSGRTMAYGLKYFLQFPVKSIQTCVLVDRRHNSFPVRADYVGLTLSTTLKEHVTVHSSKNGFSVTLD